MNGTELSGKVALVTGGSRGIGRGIAAALSGAGAMVAIIGRNGEAAKSAAAELGGEGHRGYACDVADPARAKATVSAVQEDLGPVDILVNNAGITRDNILMRMKDDEFDEVIAANLKGAFNFTRAVTKSIMKRRQGSILNITSVVGIVGNAGQANYAASKAGMVGLTKSVAKELAKSGVTVNAIAPGFIATDMTDELSDKVKDAVKANIPMGEFGAVEDVAGAALFLASPAARYMTGQVLTVDGGMVM